MYIIFNKGLPWASPVERNWEHTPDADVWLRWGIHTRKGKAQNIDFGALVFEIIKQNI